MQAGFPLRLQERHHGLGWGRRSWGEGVGGQRSDNVQCVCPAGLEQQAEQEAVRMAGFNGTYGKFGDLYPNHILPYFLPTN